MALKAENQATERQAKAKVGVFSTFAVQEVRDLFWSTFAKGQGFAKRSSWWDMIFMGLQWGRDEEIWAVILRWIFQLLLNFTIGLFGALVAFLWYLWDIISSYEPNPLTGMLMFFLAAVTAMSMCATYLLALYGSVAGTVYTVAKVAADNARLQDGNGQPRRPRHIQYQRRRPQYRRYQY